MDTIYTITLNPPKSFDLNYREQFMQNHLGNFPYKRYDFKKNLKSVLSIYRNDHGFFLVFASSPPPQINDS